MVRAVACGARGPGFSSKSFLKFFLSLKVCGGKMEPDTLICMILYFPIVEKRNHSNAICRDIEHTVLEQKKTLKEG